MISDLQKVSYDLIMRVNINKAHLFPLFRRLEMGRSTDARRQVLHTNDDE